MNAGMWGNAAGRRTPARAWLMLLGTLLTASLNSSAQQTLSAPTNNESIWEHGVGDGFRCGAQSLTLSAGAGYGISGFGSEQSHDLALGSVTYGRMLADPMGRSHWYAGNLELRVELFGGEQFSPSREWVVGVTPHIRYNLATGTRWVPYIDGGAGVSATSIRHPDLGGVFEFNLQAALGVQRFLTDRTALTIEADYLHLSSAGIYSPNLGVNCVMGMIGVSFFF